MTDDCGNSCKIPTPDETSLELPEPSTIKSLLTDFSAYNIIKITIKLLRILKQLNSESGLEGEGLPRIVKTLLIVANSEYGLGILEHLLEFGGYTYRELEVKFNTSKTTVLYVTSRLKSIDLVEYRKILPRDLNPRLVPKVPGGVPYVWVLKGAEDSVGHDTLLRYYEDVRASMHIKRVNEFYEVVDEVEVIYRERYSDDLPQAIGPDHVNRMFKDLHPELDWHLRNEGTHILLSRFRLKKG